MNTLKDLPDVHAFRIYPIKREVTNSKPALFYSEEVALSVYKATGRFESDVHLDPEARLLSPNERESQEPISSLVSIVQQGS